MTAWENELCRELSAARNGEKKAIMDRYQQLTGKSAAALYRIAGRCGMNTGRKRRQDAGRCGLTEDQLNYISGHVRLSARQRKDGTIMPVRLALEVAERNGVIKPGTISVSYLQDLLREKGINARAINAPAPHIRMRSLHPNHTHVADASICIQYYLKGSEGLKILDERQYYKNKPENFQKIKTRIIRYVLVDHYSGWLFVKYYAARGEKTLDFHDFLLSAWETKPREDLPFHGVPYNLLIDAGASNKSKTMMGFFKALEVELPAAMPHNPRRQGSAENAQRLVERFFESTLRMQPAATVEDLNGRALSWCAWWNGNQKNKHTRHGMTRSQCWLQIREEKLRRLPSRELLQWCFAAPEEDRTVAGDYSISYRSNLYDVRDIPDLIPNLSKVKVVLRPYLWPQVGVLFGGQEYQVNPIETVAGGFRADAAIINHEYKAMPETPTQRAAKRGDALAYGEEKSGTPFAGHTVFNPEDREDIAYIQRRGIHHPMEFKREDMGEVRCDVLTLMRRLREFMAVTPALNRMVRDQYGESLTQAEAERLLEIAERAGTLAAADLVAGDDGDRIKAVM